MNTLLHICCAPCANQCIDLLRTDGYAVTGYWYNPNIHPFGISQPPQLPARLRRLHRAAAH